MEGKKALGRIKYLNSVLTVRDKYVSVINNVPEIHKDLLVGGVEQVLNTKFNWNFKFNSLVARYWVSENIK